MKSDFASYSREYHKNVRLITYKVSEALISKEPLCAEIKNSVLTHMAQGYMQGNKRTTGYPRPRTAAYEMYSQCTIIETEYFWDEGYTKCALALT